MPIRLDLRIRDGWKQVDNNRFGQCMEIRFVDIDTGKVMFRYAPLLKDKEFWNQTFEKLERYDQLHKDIFGLVREVDGEQFMSMGSCRTE